MFIKDMFVKNIDRNIQSVVKVSDREENKIIEIDEYVVTEEIFHCIKKFVNSYKNTILTKNDEIGFWISGFFGSGKSHFLKILYYILNNVGMDILIKNNKCLLEIEEEIKFLSNITKDVILFNIDSKNINVIACRHLMYYGKNGNSFENLRQNIKKSLEKDKEIER